MNSETMIKAAKEWLVAGLIAILLGLLADNSIVILLIALAMFAWGCIWLVVGYNMKAKEEADNKRLFE